MTAGSHDDAKQISQRLLKKKLVACTNIFPVNSMFWWDGMIKERSEFAILAKTADGNFKKVEKEVLSMHDYDTPAIYSWKADKVTKKYGAWVKKETS